MNVAYYLNGKPVPAYIDCEGMCDTIVDLLTDERDSFGESDSDKDLILDEYNDDFIQEIALDKVTKINDSMRKYLHSKNHRITGNFNNVEYDYVLENPGELLSEMIKRLDAMEDSKRANKDRQWLTSWFWETFGTFGITYNFGEQISEFLYECHKCVEA